MITVLGPTQEGNDSETYKVELRDTGNRTLTGYLKLSSSRHQLIAELAAAQLGRALDLPIPEPFLVIIDTELVSAFGSAFAGSGQIFAFASRQAGRESYSLERMLTENHRGLLDSLGSNFDIMATVAFDEWIANTDRNPGNIVYTPANRKAWPIDHGRALTGERWPSAGLGEPWAAVANLLADINRLSWSASQRQLSIEKAHQLCRRCAELEIVNLDLDNHYARIDQNIQTSEIIEFLRERTYYTVELLCHRLNIEHLPLPRQSSSWTSSRNPP